MSKEIDNLLDNLIKEIDAQEGAPAQTEKLSETPEPASEQAREKAEAIAKGVNKSYRRPPEPVKQSIPAPNITPVVEPDPVSHFSHQRPTDPAIRMHDRLDEDSLPTPDADRRPTQIRDIDEKPKKRRKRKAAQNRSIPEPRELPKRTIPHINVPDELPPDPDAKPAPAAETVDPEREALVRSRAEKIREQLKKRTLEETPIIPPPSAEEINDMLSDLEHPAQEEETAPVEQEKEDNSIFQYLHQVLGVEEKEKEETPAESAGEERPRWFDDAPAPVPYTPQDGENYDEYDDYDDEEYDEDDDSAEETSVPSRLRHLEEDEEEEEKRENPIVGFFKNLFAKSDDDEEFEEEDSFGDEPEEDYPDTEVPLPENEIDLPPQSLPEEVTLDSTDEETFEETSDPDADDYAFGEDETPAEDDAPASREKENGGFFRDAFDESAEELAEVKADPVSHQTGAGVKQRFLSRNSYFIVGVIVFILALVGLITVIAGIIKGAGGFFSGGSVKTQLEKTLYPLAVVDVPAFNEPAELTAEGALSASIMDILMHDDLSGYTETFDMIAIPADDVLERGRTLFGVDVQTSLDTLTVAGQSFVYDAQTNCYNVPTVPMIYSYSPEVKSVKRTGDTYEVTVIFHSDEAAWQKNSRNFTEGPSKTMQATVEKKSSGYRIVRLVPAN